MNTMDRTNLIIGPYRLKNGELEKISYEEASNNPKILYIVKGRYCRDNFIKKEKYKDEIKKYLQYEPNRIVYFLCPEDDTKSHTELKYASVAIGVSPKIKDYTIFKQVFNQIIQQLNNAESIRVYGHSYGGYFASRLLREIIKYYSRSNINPGINNDNITKLKKLSIITFGGARFHNYMYQINNLTDYQPNVRHFIYINDIINVIHRKKKLKENENVIFIVPSVSSVKESYPKQNLTVKDLRFIFHNYEPFIKYIYEKTNRDLFDIRKEYSSNKVMVANIGGELVSTVKGEPSGFDTSYTIENIQYLSLGSESLKQQSAREDELLFAESASQSMRRPQTVYQGGKGKKKKQK